MDKPKRIRIDKLLVDHGYFDSRERAQRSILAGCVLVEENVIDKPGTLVRSNAPVRVVAKDKYVGRGGYKLEAALDHFNINPTDLICLDVGASTGGFTDCLLQCGARRVYAVDVTMSQLDWKLQRDDRVVKIERNARYLQAENVGEPVDLVTMDVSFISATKVLPAIAPLAKAGGDFLILVKPQFELEKGQVGKGGIVRDAALHEKAIANVIAAVTALGLEVAGVRPSRITGTEGNQEFFLHARRSG